MRVISEECIACGCCEKECPFHAVGEGAGKFEIDENCRDCGKCEKVCPVSAIKISRN